MTMPLRTPTWRGTLNPFPSVGARERGFRRSVLYNCISEVFGDHIYVRMYIYVLCTYVCMNVMYEFCIYVNAHTRTCICICDHTYMYVPTCVYIHIYIYVYMI